MKTKSVILSLLVSGIFLFQSHNSYAQSAGKTAALETIGMQGGLVLYNTYCFIGAINDGFVNKAWTKETCDDLLDEQISMMGKMYDQYSKFVETKYLTDPDDSASLMQMMKGVKLLKQEAADLKSDIDNPTDSTHGTYSDAREEAWKLIADFLDLKDDNTK